MSSDLDERVALDAVGLLQDDEQEVLLDEVAATGSEYASVYDAGAALALRCQPVQPSRETRARLMERIGSLSQQVPASPLSFIMRDEGWQQHPLISGIQFKQLALDKQRNLATLLMKVAAGTVYPAHTHRGDEECYVIDGDVIAAGRQLFAGDFHHADGGSDHDPLRTDGGCTVLLVVDARDYLDPVIQVSS
jgi:anti-sigma factor ChrR (cupin superfamily)